LVESRRHGDVLSLGIVACFCLGKWNVADRFEQVPVVEPVYPFQGCELDGLQGAPWPTTPDDLGLVEAVDVSATPTQPSLFASRMSGFHHPHATAARAKRTIFHSASPRLPTC
jgi:hypothetical protein